MDTEKIKKTITELLNNTHLDIEEISVNFDQDKRAFWCDVYLKDRYILNERQHDLLGSINHLAKRIIEKENSLSDMDERLNLTIDINGQYKRKVENLQAVAHMMAERARYFKSNIEIDPMSAWDRKVIHEFLQNALDLKTESMGDGFNRRVVIKYLG